MYNHKYLALLIIISLALSACSSISPNLPTDLPLESTSTPFPPAPTSTSTATEQPTLTPTPTPLSVTEFPDPSGYKWTPVLDGLIRPVRMVNAGDGSGRLFILEQPGIIRVVMNGALLPTPFLDISSRVTSMGSEQGLLGIAFDPKFKENGVFYLNYIDKNKPKNTVISRFSTNPSMAPDLQVGDPGSEKKILVIRQPFGNHNGGNILFGPDGMLWIGMGDGGSGGDPNNNGQSLQSLLGKILRIDVNNGDPYSIPTDNPFASGGGLPEIWATGLRNPWVFSFDPLSKGLYIADVGQDAWEEIDYLAAGFTGLPANFGWRLMEGSYPYNQAGESVPANLINPVFEYNHDLGCSVTGGEVYRGQTLPALKGIYFLGDYCTGTIWGLIFLDSGDWRSQPMFETKFKISSFGVDEQGEIYVIDLNGGVYRLDKI